MTDKYLYPQFLTYGITSKLAMAQMKQESFFLNKNIKRLL